MNHWLWRHFRPFVRRIAISPVFSLTFVQVQHQKTLAQEDGKWSSEEVGEGGSDELECGAASVGIRRRRSVLDAWRRHIAHGIVSGSTGKHTKTIVMLGAGIDFPFLCLVIRRRRRNKTGIIRLSDRYINSLYLSLLIKPSAATNSCPGPSRLSSITPDKHCRNDKEHLSERDEHAT